MTQESPASVPVSDGSESARIAGLSPAPLQHFHDADREGCTACQEPQLVVVTWEDTTNVAVWQPVDEVADMAGWTVQNVGWLVHEDDDCIIVAARQAFDAEPPQVGLAERIPKRAIVARAALPLPAGFTMTDKGWWCADHGYGCEPQNCPCGHTLRCDCWSIANEC